MRREFVEHFYNGKEAWKREFFFFTRMRGIVVTFLFTIILTIITTTGAPWWFESFPSWSIPFHYLAGGVFLFVGLMLTYGFYYLRERSRRSLDMKYILHEIADFARNKQTELYESPSAPIKLKGLSQEASSLIKRYFETLIPKHDIQIAIRILSETEEGEKKYITIARTDGFHKERQKTTEPLDPEQGLAKLLRHKEGNRGVIIINDLQKAANFGLYTKFKNDENYGSDFKTMIVAPLNGWDGSKKDMIGILYVTSKETTVFSEKHADSLGFAADIIAKVFSATIREKGLPFIKEEENEK
ncbi:hypothetical protein J7384_08710 [Endozoicomonas sp. G2_1]|uniref:hypothetical protein n=1 Tax=Endozoicomonas sp. G2_1 TaxID=2821091 RepID=UPI001ADCC61B|nr:hypothetical protein [Endozoicomonas sp. G2_1]MBO9490441.1 hypothetical protein [Endozoicomonas sp. G2_1]